MGPAGATVTRDMIESAVEAARANFARLIPGIIDETTRSLGRNLPSPSPMDQRYGDTSRTGPSTSAAAAAASAARITAAAVTTAVTTNFVYSRANTNPLGRRGQYYHHRPSK